MKFYNPFKKSRTVCSIALLFALSFLWWSTSLAYVMQSTGYRIQSDSVNLGGVSSSSTNYGLNDTLGEIGTGDSNSTNYYLHAGYWQMQESSISITSPSDITLSSINGLTGGSGEDTVTWTVTTDSIAGYTMNIKASTAPALKSSLDSFADYVPAGADPDYTFTNLAANSSFGFSPEGADTIARFRDNGSSACNTGISETSGKCWDGLSTTAATIAGSGSGNHPSGTPVIVRFRSESGGSHIQTSGNYSATITVTAVTL